MIPVIGVAVTVLATTFVGGAFAGAAAGAWAGRRYPTAIAEVGRAGRRALGIAATVAAKVVASISRASEARERAEPEQEL